MAESPKQDASDSEVALQPPRNLVQSLADLFFHVLSFLRAPTLSKLLYSSHEAELWVRMFLPALVDRRGWGGDSDANPLSTLHLSEMWDLLADVCSPVGVHYMVLRHTMFGTMLELQLSPGTTLAHFGFQASDEAAPMWCRGSFAVRGALQCRKWTDELRQRPCRTPLTQALIAQQSSYRVEHCGDRFVLRPACKQWTDARPQLQLTKRGFIAIAAEGGGLIVEDGQPVRRIEAEAPEAAC
mmetsp:Transcript_28318/g.51109  ORF Transcript_28318/g.51109 Transcript_28318/m.51109 type:complete len:241 (+) Transcript_28318:95-817(+)